MTETKLYQTKIKPLLLKKGYFFQRFEQEGIPDLYIAKNGLVIWIELKVINKECNILKPDWRPGQLAWIYEHQKKGGDIIWLCLWYINQFYFLSPQEFYHEEDLSVEYFKKEL